MKYTVNLAEGKKINGHTVYRIYANDTFTTVCGHVIYIGDRGGWIESERNLSQSGRCWVEDEAAVYGNALVCMDAVISDDAQVFGKSTVCGKSIVCSAAQVCDKLVTGANIYE